MTWVDRAGVTLTLLLPLFLLHGRGIAEAIVITLATLFLVRSTILRDFAWTRSTWVRLAAAWWGWLVLCSASQGAASFTQALGVCRFLLLVAALEAWTLGSPAARSWLARLLRWSAFYLAAQSLLQFATGRNLFGYPRGADGELTGPYRNPRAGAPLSRLLFPAILPPMRHVISGDALRRPGRAVLAALLLPAGLATLLLIGQRMPLLLALMGLVLTALLLPRLRGIVAIAAVATSILLGATSVVAPPTFNRLVTRFSAQMEDFPRSHYGQIAARALAIAEDSPALGAGYDGFRRACDDPRFFRGWGGTDGGGAAICVQHPHNAYLQALVEGGVPGLLLFAALCATWLWRLARFLWHDPAPLRVGLFVAAVIHLWPIASSTAFTSMPLSGWFFVLLGLGLAETKHYIPPRTE